MNKHVAIITDVRYRMSLAIIRDLGQSGVYVVATEHDRSTPALGMFSKYASESVFLDEEKYLNELYCLCEAKLKQTGEKPALITVSAKTSNLLLKKEERERFEKVAGFVLGKEEDYYLLNDKKRFGDFALNNGVPAPREYFAPYDRVIFPCIVKPSFGEGIGLKAWDRYRIVNTKEELEKAISFFENLCHEQPIVQQYISGAGYGCSVLSKDGEALSLISHKRIREYPVSGGPSTCCKAVVIPQLEEYAKKLVKILGFSGVVMFEFKEQDGKYYILEANPRVWGSYPLTRAAGSGFSFDWFKASFEKGNKELALDMEFNRKGKKPEFKERSMHFLLSDFAAGFSYIRNKKSGLGCGAFTDVFNPNVKGGLFEWTDIKPSLKYLSGALKRK